MRDKIIRFRGFEVTRKELISDLIFLLIGFIITLILLYFFDIHWSFYSGETIFPLSKYVGLTKGIYLIGGLIGSILGFFLIKLFLIRVKEEIK